MKISSAVGWVVVLVGVVALVSVLSATGRAVVFGLVVLWALIHTAVRMAVRP